LKVLILTYYWPPSGGSGVQRWLKFVKYLQDFGVTPVVYTVDNPDYAIQDTSLQNEVSKGVEVIRQPIWEPYKLASIFSKKKKTQTSSGFLNSKQSLAGKISTYIRANYFIPDARMFWIQPSVKYLEKYLNENSIDLIISSGPPHSLHMIGLELKKKTAIKWISDFRDPWTDIDYFHQLPLSKRAKKKHFSLEQEVLENSDAVVVVGKTMQENYLPFNINTVVLSNGYDCEVASDSVALDKKFSMTHIGLMNEDRNPKILWQALQEISQEVDGFSKDLEIQLIGKIDSIVLNSIESKGLFSNTKQIAYVPHSEVQIYQQKSQVLLLAVNKVPSAKGIVTGKIFEYLVAKRPILAIGPEDGDLAEILEETKAGIIVGFENLSKIKELIKELYQKYLGNNLNVTSKNIEQYHRKEITKQLVSLIKSTV
tara:strand:+ start:41225 stop:42502 length:1278 start_codon:yes stop_codon:yes gene_type:complete